MDDGFSTLPGEMLEAATQVPETMTSAILSVYGATKKATRIGR
jgi:hypothetical protein